MFNDSDLPAARTFLAQVLAESIKAEVKEEHGVSNAMQTILNALETGRFDAIAIECAGDHVDCRAGALHFTEPRAALVVYAGKAIALALQYDSKDGLARAFRFLAALRVPSIADDALWSFIRGERNDSTLPAQWDAFRAKLAA